MIGCSLFKVDLAPPNFACINGITFRSKPLKLIYGFWSLDIFQILVGL